MMAMPVLFAFGVNFELWALPAVGLICAGLGFWAGLVLMKRRSMQLSLPAAPGISVSRPTPLPLPALPPLPQPATPATEASPPTDPAAAEKYWAERRSAPRFQMKQQRLWLCPKPGEAPCEAWLLNRSLGGLGISVSRAIDVGSIILVNISSDNSLPWLKLEVRYCRLERGRWSLGCKYVAAAPAESYWSQLAG